MRLVDGRALRMITSWLFKNNQEVIMLPQSLPLPKRVISPLLGIPDAHKRSPLPMTKEAA